MRTHCEFAASRHHSGMAESRSVEPPQTHGWWRWTAFAAGAALCMAIAVVVRDAVRPLDWDDRWDDEW